MPIAVDGFEFLTIAGEKITAYQIIWRRYRCRARGVLEAMLDLNPHIARAHRTSPFLPVGLQIRIPINFDIMRGRPPSLPVTDLWTQKAGYTL